MQQPGDEGPRRQMWLGPIRQDQECTPGRLCLGASGGSGEGSERQKEREEGKKGRCYSGIGEIGRYGELRL